MLNVELTSLDSWTSSSLHVTLVVILRIHHSISLLKSSDDVSLLINTGLPSPWNSCKLIHGIHCIQSLFRLRHWIHHKLIDLTVDCQLMGPILCIHSVLIEVLVLTGLVERLLVSLVWLGNVLLGTDDA